MLTVKAGHRGQAPRAKSCHSSVTVTVGRPADNGVLRAQTAPPKSLVGLVKSEDFDQILFRLPWLQLQAV